jgi:hypothetical protein
MYTLSLIWFNINALGFFKEFYIYNNSGFNYYFFIYLISLRKKAPLFIYVPSSITSSTFALLLLLLYRSAVYIILAHIMCFSA